MNTKIKEGTGEELDILDLEKEITSVENNALKEEKNNVSRAYAILDKQLHDIISQIPYPQTEEFTTGDYEEIIQIQYEKSANRPHWEKRDQQRTYCNSGSLYCGHLLLRGGEYYIMDSGLDSRELDEGSSIMLVNADDKNYSDIVRAWRFPDGKNVEFSRNVTIKNKMVKSVDVILDAGNAILSNITDAYLRKAFIENRKSSSSNPSDNMQSIYQTIQKKQDNIRLLNVNDSFITQGCAGSGKTMVLLHRLRYLLFNKDIDSDKYVFLVPSLRFKMFIKNIATEFKISEKNIFSYFSYYQTLCGKGKEILDDNANELVFNEDFLAKVYSNDFYSETYNKLFEELQRQVDEVIEYSEERLNELMICEEKAIDEEIKDIETETLTKINSIINTISEHLTNSLNSIENVPLIIEEIQDIYNRNKSIQDTLVKDDYDIKISPEDDRIKTNKVLRNLKSEIEKEETAVKNANIFTARAHKNKLEKLKEQYDKGYKDIEQNIIDEEKKILAQKNADKKFIFDGITLEDIDDIIKKISLFYKDAEIKITDAKSSKENINEIIADKYEDGIDALNTLIDISSSIRDEKCKYVTNLIPAYEYFVSVMKIGMKLVKAFRNKSNEDEKKLEKIKLFSERTDFQAQGYLNSLLLNICKNEIKEKFGITICKLYKHYWFINLYCRYLTRPQNNQKYGFVFIDEGQDLSKAEIELIYKINSNHFFAGGEQIINPVMNIFGDVNQTITKHGIYNWDEIGFINTRYLLDENFRNPSQIVDYCNKTLPFTMKKMGVDIEPVDKFKSITDALNVLREKKNHIYIVKDEYSRKDLQIELNEHRLDYKAIYTVKDVKGLEFRETIVFDRDMTENERYIAYTRALVKLNIFDELKRHIDKDEKLYVQGDDEEND